MPPPVSPPHRFRRRLAIAFVLVAAGAGGLVALVSVAIIERYRESAFADRSREVAAVSVALAPAELAVEDVPALLRTYREQGDFETVLVVGSTVASTSERLDLETVPDSVRRGAALDGDARTEVDGRQYLVVAGGEGGSGAELYFFFPRADLVADLAEDQRVLVLVWVAVTVAAALVGTLVARRTLAPVTRAADAARDLSEGMLHTRLTSNRRDEFGMWSESFNEMAAALQTRIDELAAARDRERRFTADVAHDLRTPVTALVAEADLLMAHVDDLPESARRPAELLAGDARRLAGLVESLLELARLEAGRAALVLEDVELQRVVRRAVGLMTGGQQVELQLASVSARTDPARWERIARNLVSNALQHGGGDVRVALREQGGDAVVEVSDGGPGIGPTQLARVFDRFYRGDGARAGGGSGLGLAIAREDARLLGGDLTVESEPGHGTTFRLRVPALRPGSEDREGTAGSEGEPSEL